LTGQKDPVVTGLGQCSLDYISVVDGFPPEDQKTEAEELIIEGGGPVATALVSLSRLGVATRFLGRVSDDPAGTEIRRGLRAEGVDTRGLRTLKGGQSQTAFIIANRRDATRTILWKRATVAPLKPAEVRPAHIRDSKFLLVDGLMHEASMHAAKIARANGIPVMLDAGTMKPGITELAALSDYVVCSERFAASFSDKPKTALGLISTISPNIRAVTITLGPRGSITWHRTGSGPKANVFRQKAFRVIAVDTTGAGDVFHGGYIYGLLCGWPLTRVVEFASAFAALKCTRAGGRAGIPTLAATLRLIKLQD